MSMVAFRRADAQATDNQVFTVTVPTVLTITGPANVSVNHDASNNDQVFSAQQWTASVNDVDGATVIFQTNQAFTHSTATAYKRDAKLDLAIASSDPTASWAVSTATDQTNYAGADGVAAVQASSTAPGDAAFDLTVTFITTDFSSLAAGDYTTTVTATLTAN
jgi:hypothetical protein